MADIVELLAERRKWRYAGDCKCGKCCLVPHEMLCSAIDEIKRLRALRGALRTMTRFAEDLGLAGFTTHIGFMRRAEAVDYAKAMHEATKDRAQSAAPPIQGTPPQ